MYVFSNFWKKKQLILSLLISLAACKVYNEGLVKVDFTVWLQLHQSTKLVELQIVVVLTRWISNEYSRCVHVCKQDTDSIF